MYAEHVHERGMQDPKYFMPPITYCMTKLSRRLGVQISAWHSIDFDVFWDEARREGAIA